MDFDPKAMLLLVDLLRKDPKVGAACGRIHPTGSGPMVWYQKFEYAMGHWMQKATEHVLGKKDTIISLQEKRQIWRYLNIAW